MKSRVFLLMALLATACQNPNDIGAKDTSRSQGPPEGFRYSSNPVAYKVGTAVTANSVVTDRGAPITRFAISPETLPAGLTFDTVTGLISGTPTAAAATTEFTVTAYNSFGSRFVKLYLRTTNSVATKLSFTVQPSNAVAGASLSPTVVVSALGADNAVDSTFTSETVLSFANNAGSGNLLGTKSVAAVAGVSTFTGISVDTVGTGYTLGAASNGLTSATSSAFNITAGAATQLRFTTQPTNAVAGASISPAVVVKATDAYGNVNTSYTSNITVAIGTNPGSGTLSGTTTVAATAGVSTFSNLSINKTGTGYTLAATSGALTGTSSTFNITPGTATQLGFNVQPSNTVAATNITPGVVIKALDAYNNVATSFTGAVTVAIGTNPNGGTLSGTVIGLAVAGSVTFSTLKIDKSGTGYTLVSGAAGLTGATSSSFNITAGTPTQLRFTVQPSNTANHAPITPAVQVSAVDANLNVVPTFTANIIVAIGTNPAAGTLSGSTSVSAVAGVATFSNLSLDQNGTGYTLTASSGALAGATSSAFNVIPGTATQLKFTVQPSNATANSTIAPSIQVTAYDAYMNIATGFTSNVTVAIGTNPSAGLLSGTTTSAAVAGVATFNGLSINKAGSGYTLAATSGVLSGDTSLGFNIAPDTATQLAFTVEPSNATAGASISPNIQVTAYDADMNVDTTYSGSITLAIGANPGSGTLSGTVTVAAAAGVASFPGLSINKVGTGYTLTAASGALTGDTSAAFNILPGAATLLQFTAQPSNAVSAVAISPSVTVTAYDANMNVDTNYAANVTVAIGTNPGAGTLSGTKTVAAASGVATFATLSIDKVGTGYTLTAASGVLTGDTSATFNITPAAATQLKWTIQPSSTMSASATMPAVAVTAYDANMNLATSFAGNVTVAIGTNPSGAVLSGTLTVAASSGVATFSDLSIDKMGNGYTMTAASGALAGDTSASFNITHGPATQLVITTEPSTAVAAVSISPAVQVTAYDADMNVATSFSGNVTIAIANNPGSGTLSGTATVAAATGVATFSNLSINKVGTGYTLSVSSGALTTDTSSAFNITPAAATQLLITAQPSNAVSAATISPAVQVTAYDANMNVDTNYVSNITVAIGTNPGSGTLSGTKIVAASSGVASFSTLSIDKAGTGYTLGATSGVLAAATSGAFNITPGAATQLGFTVQPSNTGAAATISPAIQVTAYDAHLNVDTSYSANITVAIGTNPGSGTLSGTATAAASSGVATFSNLSINKVGTGYTLTAASGALSGGTSATFNITAGAATQLHFTVQPSNALAAASISPAIQVTAYDADMNVATTYSANVTIAIGTNPGSGTLSGTATAAASSGVATFSNLSINKVGAGYTLTAASGALTGDTSSTFNITPAAATQLKFTVQPTNAVSTASVSPTVQVTAYDANMNVDTSYAANITVAIGTNPGTGTLSGTKTAAAASGVASFSNLSIDKTGTGYTLTAASGALTADTSSTFNITPGAATQLGFTVQPANTAAATSISPAVQVTAYDAQMNVATGYSANVTIAMGTNPGGGALTGTVTVAASSGVASFSTLKIDKVGVGYTLTGSSGALSGATSSTFNITPAAATQLKFTVQPSNAIAATSISPAIQVTAYDADMNVDTSYSANITIAIGTNPGTGTLSGTATAAATSGVATFSNLSIQKVGTGYTLTAASGALSGDTSGAFNITPASATQLAFTVEPTNTVSATSISPAVQVTAYDANMNIDTNYASNVTIAIASNPGTGTLSGTKTIAAASGVATYSNLSIDKAGTGYTLSVSSGALTVDTSAAFNISAGTATILAFTVQPAATLAGVTITPAVQVSAQDAQGNTVTGYSGNITVAIGTNPAAGTLSGTLTAAAVNGVSTFNDFSIEHAGNGYTLTATAPSMTGGTSDPFNINVVIPTKLIFNVEPSNVVDCASISPAVRVYAVDSANHLAITYTSNVTMAFGTNAGGGTLSGTATVAASGGIATFSNLSVDKPANGYTLTASSGVLTGATSAAFNVTPGAVATLAYSTQPSHARPTGTINPSIVVRALDTCAGGQIVNTFIGNVTLSLSTNPPTATLGGTVTRAASAGVATFNDITVSKSSYSASGAYVIRASDGTHTVDSTAFNVGIDLVVPIELLDSGVASDNGASTTTFERTRTGFDSSKYDGTITYSSEALCTNLDSTSKTVVIVDQGGVSRGVLTVPATGTLTYVTGTFAPLAGTTSLRLRVDDTTGQDQLRCFMARALVRQQYASKTRVYRPLGALAYNFYSNTDEDNQNSLDGTTTPIATNSAAASTSTSNAERAHRINFNSSALGSTIVGYQFEAVCSCNQNNAGAAIIRNMTAGADVAGSETGNCPQDTLGLMTASWAADANWISTNDFEVKLKSTGGFLPRKWLYKSGLWIELTNLQNVPILFRVGGYSSLAANTIQSEVGAVINTSYFAGQTGTYTVNFEVSGREPTVGTSDITLYTINGAGSIGSSNINFGSTTKSRIRSGTVSITDGDRFTIRSNVTTGTIESSGAFVIIRPQ